MLTQNNLNTQNCNFYIGERKVELKDSKTGEVNGEMVIDQLHFIKQKVRRYMGMFFIPFIL